MRARSLLLAALVTVAATGCRDREAPPPEPTYSRDESLVLETLSDFWGALASALADADVEVDDPAELARALHVRMSPMLDLVRAGGKLYAELPAERRAAVHQELFRREPETMSALMVHTSRFAARFQDPERAREFRPIARAVFEPWSEAGAFWVFEGFGPAAVREVTEWTTETEEQERARKAALAAELQSSD